MASQRAFTCRAAVPERSRRARHEGLPSCKRCWAPVRREAGDAVRAWGQNLAPAINSNKLPDTKLTVLTPFAPLGVT